MSTLMTKEERWIETRCFYQELVKKYRLRLDPMVDLINQLRKAGFCEKFYPGNSHEALGISTASEYFERTERNMVYLTYHYDTDTYEIRYQKGQENTESTEACKRDEIYGKLAKIEDWLKNQTNNEET